MLDGVLGFGLILGLFVYLSHFFKTDDPAYSNFMRWICYGLCMALLSVSGIPEALMLMFILSLLAFLIFDIWLVIKGYTFDAFLRLFRGEDENDWGELK